MAVQTQPTAQTVYYPESDGNPIADNTLQFRWIVTIQGGIDALFADNLNVFVAGDLLWYPVEGDNQTRVAPDVLVAFGRPKGDRGSYRQWEEGGIAPQVVFEILSPGNRQGEMSRRFDFYERFGVEEYYLYDPKRLDFTGWVRRDGKLRLAETVSSFVSPRMGVRFEIREGEELRLFTPDGTPFQTFIENATARRQAETERDKAQEQVERLAARLRELGVDPDAA